MTSQGGFPHPEGRNDKPESASLPCHSEERSDVGISGRQLRFRRWLSYDPAGYCEIATSAAPPRNDTSGDYGGAPAPFYR